MTLTYGFYNSVSSDRLYNAIQMSSIFDGVIVDGVFASLGDSMIVIPNFNMNLLVGTGRAWFNHTWSYNDSPFSVIITPSNPILPRIDAVILEINSSESVRANSIKVIAGTPATVPVPPTLINTGTLHQYPLAYVLVGAGVGAIMGSDITNMVGTSECPFVTGPLSVISTEELIEQWHSEWHEWFDFVVNELSEEQFGNLQNQINQHNHSEPLNTQVVLNGIADNSIDDTKVGNRVPQFYRRHGGDPTNWDVPGNTVYTPGPVRIRGGVYQWTGSPANNGIIIVSLGGVAFSAKPFVLVNYIGSVANPVWIGIDDFTSSTFRVRWKTDNGSNIQVLTFSWIAIGPE